MKINYVGKCLLIEEDNARGEKEQVLVIGDLHFGYEGVMRQRGVQVPLGIYGQIVKDFDEIYDFVVNKYLDGKIKIGNKKKEKIKLSHDRKIKNNENNRLVQVGNIEKGDVEESNNIESEEGKLDKIILLGDVKHEFGQVLKEEWQEIENFILHLRGRCKELVIIEGNHDAVLFPILKKMGIAGEEHYIWNGFAFLHGDKSFEEIYDGGVKYWVMGHGHPAVTLHDKVKKEKYKCFLVGEFKERGERKGNGRKKIIIVPSFFPLVEGTDAREFDMGFAWNFDLKKFDVKVVGDDLKVLDFGKLGKLD